NTSARAAAEQTRDSPRQQAAPKFERKDGERSRPQIAAALRRQRLASAFSNRRERLAVRFPCEGRAERPGFCREPAPEKTIAGGRHPRRRIRPRRIRLRRATISRRAPPSSRSANRLLSRRRSASPHRNLVRVRQRFAPAFQNVFALPPRF